MSGCQAWTVTPQSEMDELEAEKQSELEITL